MNTLAKVILLLSAALFVVSIFYIRRLPPREEILKELYSDPAQAETRQKPFTVARKGTTYTILPRYAYTLHGLVVTYHDNASWFDVPYQDWGNHLRSRLVGALWGMSILPIDWRRYLRTRVIDAYWKPDTSQKDWEDYLNTIDISTIWGRNIEAGDYAKMKFFYARGTGDYRRDTPADFDDRYFASSHLLTDNEDIEKEIMKTRAGDQILVKGFLANYAHEDGRFSHTTSVSRSDTGSGASEIIFVTEYRILKEGNTPWRTLQRYARIAIILCSIFIAIALFFED